MGAKALLRKVRRNGAKSRQGLLTFFLRAFAPRARTRAFRSRFVFEASTYILNIKHISFNLEICLLFHILILFFERQINQIEYINILSLSSNAYLDISVSRFCLLVTLHTNNFCFLQFVFQRLLFFRQFVILVA